MGLTVNRFSQGPFGENTYLVTDSATGFKAVIDPGYFGDDIAKEIGDKGSLKYILLTHGHYDHFAAVSEYINEYGNAVFATPKGEDYLLHRSKENLKLSGGHPSGTCPDSSILLEEGNSLMLGETEIRVIETPGHTEGGICFATDSEVFSGDTLFRLSVGNTSFETGDWATLLKSIETKLYTLNEELIVYPGHGEVTTIGYEKRANPFV